MQLDPSDFHTHPDARRFSEAVGDEREAMDILARLIPLGQILEPIDVANAVLFLASDESRMITGAELIIDGGLSAGYMPPI